MEPLPQGELCITGAERSAKDLSSRLDRYAGSLQEVRLDLLERIDDEVFALLRSPRLIAVCRGAREGGAFQGPEEERHSILERALDARPGFLDVELSTARAARDRLLAKARAGGTRFVLSFHGFGRFSEEVERAGTLSNEPADVVKIALAVQDAAELRPLRALLPGEARPVVRIGMGDSGLLSRILFRRFGSPWSYVAADGGEPTAPGQVSLSRARSLRAHEADGLTPLGVIGGPQVLRSNGQRVYNSLFAARQLPFHYLPVVGERPEILGLLEELGFAGVAVTMPAKEQLVPHLHELDPAAQSVGAVNTILFRNGRRLGMNTDLLALQTLLPEGNGSRALILGAGGAARAAVCALRSLGWQVAVTGRTLSRAASLEALGARAIPWGERGGERFELLVNATPCGSDGKCDPLPDPLPLAGCTVLDMVASREPTPLIARARAAGAATITGTEMWIAQGILQMRAITGLSLSPEDLREHLHG